MQNKQTNEAQNFFMRATSNNIYSFFYAFPFLSKEDNTHTHKKRETN